MLRIKILITNVFVCSVCFCQSPQIKEWLIFDSTHTASTIDWNKSNITEHALKKIDIEKLLLMKSNQAKRDCPEFGVTDNHYYRLLIKFGQVNEIKNIQNSVSVNGWLKDQKGKALFKGSVTISKVYEYYDEVQEYKIWEIDGDFSFRITQRGILKGNLKCALRISETGNTIEFYDIIHEEGNYKIWIGQMHSFYEIKNKLYAWGFNRFPEEIFPGFDIGGGEFSVNYKYLENGWSKTFSKEKYIKDIASMISVNDYPYYNVKNFEDLINNWDLIEEKMDHTAYSEGLGKLDLGCYE